MPDLLDALDCAMKLLLRAQHDLEDADFEPGDGSSLEDITLVLGEGGEGRNELRRDARPGLFKGNPATC